MITDIEDITWPRGDMKIFHSFSTNEIPNHFTFRWKRRDLLCNHSNSDIFTCEENMLFSRVKISCFRATAHLVFHWCLYNKRVLLRFYFASPPLFLSKPEYCLKRPCR